MGKVIEFRGDHEGDDVASLIREWLSARGSVFQPKATLTVSVAEWRQIVRRVGRELKRPVRTLDSADGVHAVVADWPRDDREQAITDKAMRAVVESVGAAWAPTPSDPE